MNLLNNEFDSLRAILKEWTSQKNEESLDKLEGEVFELAHKVMREEISLGAEDYYDFVEEVCSFLDSKSKVRAGKVMKSLMKLLLKSSKVADYKSFCLEKCIDWTINRNYIYLKRNLSLKYLKQLICSSELLEFIQKANRLEVELKDFDEKELLLKLNLLKCECFVRLKNFQKAKSILVEAKQCCNKIFVSSINEALLNFQSGIVCLHDENELPNAFSYFSEAYNGFKELKMTENAMESFVFMCLSKVFMESPSEVPTLISMNNFNESSNEVLLSVKKLASASHRGSILELRESLDKISNSLDFSFPLLPSLKDLEKKIIEKEILRVIKPYSAIDLQRVSSELSLSAECTQKILMEMILDKKIEGWIDQNVDTLVLFSNTLNVLHLKCLETLNRLNVMIEDISDVID